jgi:hypothetical protein
MPGNRESSDFSSSLRLEFPAAQRVETLRGQRLRAVTPATPAQGAKGATSAATDTRPGMVTLIALYEFARAAILIGVYVYVLNHTGIRIESESFWTLFYVLSNGLMRVSSLLPLTIGYAAAIGICLWMRVNWGRRVLIVSSCLAVFRLVGFLMTFSAVTYAAKQEHIAQVAYLKDAACMLTAVNVVIGLYLAFGPDVAEAFGQEK